MDSFQNIIPQTPIIISIEIVCGFIWLFIFFYKVESKKFAFNYNKILKDKEWWRTVSSTMSHVQLMHLAFNLVSLWNSRFVERRFGSAYFFELTFLLLIMSNASMLATYWIMSNYFNRKEYVDNMWAVGYSAVLFGYMAFECVLWNGNMDIFGVYIPYYLGPFLLLIVISLIVPNASFCGHFSGIVSGFILGVHPIQDKQTIAVLFWLLFVPFVILMCYSIYTTNVCGLSALATEVLTPTRRTKIVNGVIVRESA